MICQRVIKDPNSPLRGNYFIFIQIDSYHGFCITLKVRMTLAAAYEFRTKGKALARKKDHPLHNVYFGLDTSLSTRVRILVLLIGTYNKSYCFVSCCTFYNILDFTEHQPSINRAKYHP